MGSAQCLCYARQGDSFFLRNVFIYETDVAQNELNVKMTCVSQASFGPRELFVCLKGCKYAHICLIFCDLCCIFDFTCLLLRLLRMLIFLGTR